MTDIETEDERLKRIKKESAETLMMAGHLLKRNEALMLRFIAEDLQAPSEAHAQSSINVALMMLGALAGMIMSNAVTVKINEPDNLH